MTPYLHCIWKFWSRPCFVFRKTTKHENVCLSQGLTLDTNLIVFFTLSHLFIITFYALVLAHVFLTIWTHLSTIFHILCNVSIHNHMFHNTFDTILLSWNKIILGFVWGWAWHDFFLHFADVIAFDEC